MQAQSPAMRGLLASPRTRTFSSLRKLYHVATGDCLFPITFGILLPGLPAEYLFDRQGYAVLIIRSRHLPTTALSESPNLRARVAHHHPVTGIVQHLEVIQVVTDGHDLIRLQTAYARQAIESGAP